MASDKQIWHKMAMSIGRWTTMIVVLMLTAGQLAAQRKTMETPSSASLRPAIKISSGPISPTSVERVSATDVRLTYDGNPQNEPAIAVNPFDNNQIVGGMNDYGINPSGFVGNGVLFSTNAGSAWTRNITGVPFLSGFDNKGGDPAICWNGSGRVFYTFIAQGSGGTTNFERNNGVFISTSLTVGATWSTPVGIATNTYSGTDVNFEDKIFCAADYSVTSPYYGRVYVSWTRFYSGAHPNGGSFGGDIMSSFSTDNGATWSSPVIVSSAANEPANTGTGSSGRSFVQGSEPSVASTGDVYIEYWFGGRMNVSRSTDGGATWGFPGKPFGTTFGVTSVQSPQPFETFRVNAFGNIETDPRRPGNLYAVATDGNIDTAGVGRDGGGDIVFARSTDNGATWSSTRILNDDAAGNNQVWPAMAVSTFGVISVIWYDTRNDPVGPIKDLDVYWTRSSDGGVTWSPNFRITDAAFDPNTGTPFPDSSFFGDYIGIAASTDNTFHMMWTDNRDGATGHQDIYYDYRMVDFVPGFVAPGDMYASTGNDGNGLIIRINPSTGAGTYVGPTGIASMPGLAITSGGAMFGTNSPPAATTLWGVDGVTGAAHWWATSGPPPWLDAIAFGPGDLLYGLTHSGELYTIDSYSGASTLVGSTGLGGWAGLAFDPTNGDLYASMGGTITFPATPDQIYQIDPFTATPTLIGATGLGGSTPDICFDASGSLYGVKGDNAAVSMFIAINKSTGSGTVIGSTGIRNISGLASGLAIRNSNWSQLGGKLVGAGPGGNAQQGRAVAVSADGSTAIVGGYLDNSNVGAAWMWSRAGSVWSQQGNKLVGTGAAGAALQGCSVALSADGNTAIVGGNSDNGSAGAAWIWTRTAGVWSQQGTKLVGAGGVGVSMQGSSVALSADGNTAAVGGVNDGTYVGAVWIWTRSGGAWTQQGGKLVGTGAWGNASQGASVALSADGNTLIVGGDGDYFGEGAVWVWTRTGGVWTQQGNKLVGTGSVGATGSHQGRSVSLSSDGNTTLIGGEWNDSGAGAAWVWTRTGGVWTQQGNKLVGTGAIGAAHQGLSVSLSHDGNTAIVGGPEDNGLNGAVWVFLRSGGSWSQRTNKLVSVGAIGVAQLGISVSTSSDGSVVLAGGNFDDVFKGAAWVFSTVRIPTAEGWQETFGPAGGATQVLDIIHEKMLVAGTKVGGVFRSTNNGAQWEAFNDGLSAIDILSFSHATDGTLFAGTNGSGIFALGPLDSKWHLATNSLSSNVVTCLLSEPHEYVFAGTSEAGVYRSAGGSKDWIAMNVGLTDPVIQALAMDSRGAIYAGTGSTAEPVFMTLNYGESWSNAGRGIKTKKVQALVVGVHDDLYAGTIDNGIWRTTSQGSEWTQVGLPGANIQSLYINQTGSIFAGTSSRSGGVYRSTDDGISWKQFGLSDQLPQAFVANSEGILFAGIQSGWVWKTLSTTLTDMSDPERGKPSAFRLEQNYPNPFNPTTVVRYQVPGVRGQQSGAGTVRLAVYDLLGREVVVLVNEKKEPGGYTVTWDARGMASGVYICRLTAGQFVQSRKMILVR